LLVCSSIHPVLDGRCLLDGLSVELSIYAEINLALNAEAYKEGRHPGYEKTALDGIRLSLGYINNNKIKVVVNGGALNPKGLALEVQKLVLHKQ
jgi:hypothetical protein